MVHHAWGPQGQGHVAWLWKKLVILISIVDMLLGSLIRGRDTHEWAKIYSLYSILAYKYGVETGWFGIPPLYKKMYPVKVMHT